MKKIALFCGLLIITMLLCFFTSCKKSSSEVEKPVPKPIPTSVTDIDGNVYNVKRFDDKLWMTENLRVTRYDTETPRVHDTIYEATNEQGVDMQKPYFKDARSFEESPFTDNLNTVSRNSLGLLYNWSAAAGTTVNNTTIKDTIQGICPNGWRLPTPADFESLCNHFGGKELAGKKLKSISGWYMDSGTDESEMCCYPAGLAIRNDVSFMGKQTIFWSSKSLPFNNSKAEALKLFFGQDEATLQGINKIQANSVRCILDLNGSYIGF